MDPSLFAFAFDGHVDHNSINPLEMTNYERFGYICGVTAVIVAIIWDRIKKRASDAKEDSPAIFAPKMQDTLGDNTKNGNPTN